MSKVRFWCALSGALLFTACASSSASSSRPRGGSTAPAAETAAQTPQPEVGPCKNCRLASTGRVTGEWQAAGCVADAAKMVIEGEHPPVAYPVSEPRVEVLEGEGAGDTFPLSAEADTFDVDTPFEASLDDGVEVKLWTRAVLWVTDTEGQTCGVLLAIDK